MGVVRQLIENYREEEPMDWTTVPCQGKILDGKRDCPKRIKYLVCYQPSGEDGKWLPEDVSPTCTTHLAQAIERQMKHNGSDGVKVAKLW